ncbi:MAG: hypothetical protein OEV43_09450, partial [Coriobacteriia bacterium]|nr:hypothetical protein [Coriobacteriia bacterium]
MNRVIGTTICAALLAATCAIPASAQPSSETSPTPTLDEATTRVLDLESQIEELRAVQIAIEERITVTNLRIFRQQDVLSSTRQRLDDAQNAYEERLVRMYKSSTSDPITVLLGAESFADFYTRLFLLTRIVREDREAYLDATVAEASAQYEARLLDELKIQDVELRRIKEQRLAELQSALDEQEVLLTRLTKDAQALLAQKRSQNATSRRQWEESSIPPEQGVPLVPAIVEPYAETFLVAEYQPKRYRTTGKSMEAVCSWYGNEFHGRRTASGQIFNQNDLTCASRTLAFGTRLALTRGNRRVVVVVNDRG